MNWTEGLIDELAGAGHEHLDPTFVAGYDRKAGLDADAKDEVRLLRGLGLDEHATLVDLGAGTGTFALAAAATCRRVVAVDVSPEMVAATKKKVAELGVSNVECVQAGFLSYAHDGAPADFVYSRNALHHLPDFWKGLALRRMALMLRQGGILRLRDIVYAFDPPAAERFIRDWLDSGSERPDVGWTRAEFEEHLRHEHSTFSWLLESMLERAGFEVKEADYGARRVYAHYVCVRTDKAESATGS
jgi:ubiquinone/menaquinone biosynthesis C-methylase UbiE